MNPDNHREDNRQGEAAFDRSAPGVIGVCFPMFMLLFHIQLAVSQNRPCREYV
jgi:hypothetical protein